MSKTIRCKKQLQTMPTHLARRTFSSTVTLEFYVTVIYIPNLVTVQNVPADLRE